MPAMTKSLVYKCVGTDGVVTYQDQSCGQGETSEQFKIMSRISSSSGNTAGVARTQPSGNWVGTRDTRLKAYLTSGGSFRMTDHTGASLMGTWKKKDKNYTVDAKFQGTSFPVNMRYQASTDTLYLSKPGFLSVMKEYRRQ